MKKARSGLSSVDLALFYSTCLLLVITGALWLYFDSFVLVETKIGMQKHPWQSLILINHGVGSWLFIGLLGWLLGRHLPFVWPQNRKRTSGIILTTLVFITSLSGFGLYYLSAEMAREWISLLHWTFGFGFIGLMLIHRR